MNAQTKIEASTLASAMALAFAEIEGATKSATNPHFGKKYADLSAVLAAIKPPLIAHNLFFTQRTQPSQDGVTIETVLHHASGEEMSLGSLFVPADKRDAQKFGSALSYARRYSLLTAFGVPTEDDDGNAASRPAPRQEVEAMPVSKADVDLITTLAGAVKKPIGDILKAHNIQQLTQLTAKQATNVINRLRSMETTGA